MKIRFEKGRFFRGYPNLGSRKVKIRGPKIAHSTVGTLETVYTYTTITHGKPLYQNQHKSVGGKGDSFFEFGPGRDDKKIIILQFTLVGYPAPIFFSITAPAALK